LVGVVYDGLSAEAKESIFVQGRQPRATTPFSPASGPVTGSFRGLPQKATSLQFKAQAIELLALGRPVADLAEELCVSANLLYSWKSSSQGAQVGSEGGRAVGEDAAADDPRALRREIALLRQENEILKKAAVILGTRTPPNCAR
jgi:transposase